MKVLRVTGRIFLLLVILLLGTLAALMAGETKGMALSGLSGVTVHAYASQRTHDVIYAAFSGGRQPAGVVRSDDAGLTWQIVSSGPGVAVNALVVDPVNTSTAYAGTAGGPAYTSSSLWESDTGGVSWHRFGMGLPEDSNGYAPSVTALISNPWEPSILYIGTDGQGVYRYDVRNNGYRLVGGTSLYDASVLHLAALPNGRLYAVTSEGLFTIEEDTWIHIETVPERLVSLAVVGADPAVLYAGGSSLGLFKSSDGGASWLLVGPTRNQNAGTSLRITAVSVDDEDPDHVVVASAYVLGGKLIGNAIHESQDAGATWSKVADLEEVASQVNVDGSVIFAATGNGLLRYGRQRTQQPFATSLPNSLGLTNPTGLQVLILTVTLGLSALAALGKGDWLSGRRSPVVA